jgi:hypothetical protein
MKEELEYMDQSLRKEIRDYSPEVPDGIWENIAINLASKEKSRKIPALFWRVAAGIALFLGTASLGTYLFLNKPDTGQISENMNGQVNTEKNILPSNSTPEKQIGIDDSLNRSFHPLTNNAVSEVSKKQSGIKKKTAVLASNEKAATAINNNTEDNNVKKSDSSSFASVLTDNMAGNDQKLSSLNTNDFPDIITDEETAENLIPVDSTATSNNTSDIGNNKQDYIWENTDDANETKVKKENQWLIGGEAGPQYTYRTVSSDVTAKELLDMSNKDEQGMIAYAAGIHIEYKPARRFSVQSGIYYSKYSVEAPVNVYVQSKNLDNLTPTNQIRSVKTSDIIIRFPNSSVEIGEVNSTSVDASPSFNDASSESLEYMAASDIPENTSYSRNYEYIEIPIIARYAVIDRKISVELLGGLSTNILVNNNIDIQFPVELPSEYETKDINTLNYSSTLGFGIGYEISKKLTLSVEPQFKYFLGSQSYSRNDVRPYSLGIYTGVKYLF